MGEFTNGKVMKIVTFLLSILVIIINIFFVTVQLTEYLTAETHWLYYVCIVVVASLYLSFVGYLSLYMLITLGKGYSIFLDTKNIWSDIVTKSSCLT